MKIAVIGLGYVGCVAAAKLAQSGHEVTGVDVNPLKVKQINHGIPTVIEPGLEAVIEDAVSSGRLRAVGDLKSIADDMDIFYVCVGTPQSPNGDLDMSFILHVAEEIAHSVRLDGLKKTFITRSTVKPGTSASIQQIIMEKNISVVMNPEFLREGSALKDWDEPSLVVIGSFDDYGRAVVKKLHNDVSAPTFFVKPETAEIIKYVNNSWHALKVAFGNEIGRICRVLNISHEELMNVFIADGRLNLSSYYLRPGMPYGGSCLPKDLSALIVLAQNNNISLPVLQSVEVSNLEHINHIVDIILNTGKKKLGIAGLAFKKDTDDLRNSPSISIIKNLLKYGIDVYIYDSNVSLDDLIGQNKAQVQDILHVLRNGFMRDLDDMIQKVDVVAVIHDMDERIESLKKLNPDKQFLNFAKYKV